MLNACAESDHWSIYVNIDSVNEPMFGVQKLSTCIPSISNCSRRWRESGELLSTFGVQIVPVSVLSISGSRFSDRKRFERP